VKIHMNPFHTLQTKFLKKIHVNPFHILQNNFLKIIFNNISLRHRNSK